jgi:hypothetical protein
LKELRVTRPSYGCCSATRKRSELTADVRYTDLVLAGSAVWSGDHHILHGDPVQEL